MSPDFDEDEAVDGRIHVPKTSEILADKIRAQIVTGKLSAGAALPPEGQLMESLGISRPTLREAFRILEAEGLISVVRGSHKGATVRKPSVQLVSRYAGYVLQAQGTTIADLFQARLAIEPTVVRWLATDKGAGRMGPVREVLTRLTELAEAGAYEDFIEHVETFHQALVVASGNNTLVFLSRMLVNLSRRHERHYARRRKQTKKARIDTMGQGLKSFEKVVALIEAGDVEGAVAHWRLHLQNANKTWASPGEGGRVVDSLGA